MFINVTWVKLLWGHTLKDLWNSPCLKWAWKVISSGVFIINTKHTSFLIYDQVTSIEIWSTNLAGFCRKLPGKALHHLPHDRRSADISCSAQSSGRAVPGLLVRAAAFHGPTLAETQRTGETRRRRDHLWRESLPTTRRPSEGYWTSAVDRPCQTTADQRNTAASELRGQSQVADRTLPMRKWMLCNNTKWKHWIIKLQQRAFITWFIIIIIIWACRCEQGRWHSMATVLEMHVAT